MRLWLVVVLVCCVVAARASAQGQGCHCEGHECYCCEHMDIPHIVNAEACLNLTYIPQSLAVSLTFSLDNNVIFNKTVSLEDPDVCFGVPYIPLLKLCVDFTNVNITSQEVSGCVAVGAEVLGKQLLTLPLGCFHFDLDLVLVDALPAPQRGPAPTSAPVLRVARTRGPLHAPVTITARSAARAVRRVRVLP